MKINDFKDRIPEIERILGYTFRDKSLLTQAFTRSSWCNEQPDGSYRSNEVLEFFGDSVLSVAIISFLLQSHTERYRHGIMTELGEGDFSNIKSKLSDKTNLSRSTKKLGLQKFLLLGEGDAKLGIAEEPSVMEDLFESIIGAIFIDSDRDISAVSRVVGRILDVSVYTDKNPTSASPKNALQEFCADKRRRLPPPVYKTLGEEGPDHKKTYERGVYIADRLIASAKGKNQKIADSLAAEAALAILKDEEAAITPPKAKMQKPAATEQPKTGVSGGKNKKTPPPRAKKTQKSPAKNSPEPQSGAKTETKMDATKQTAEARGEAHARREVKPGGKTEPKSAREGSESAPTDGGAGSARSRKTVGIAVKKKPAREVAAESEAARLRAYALKKSVATPTFRDLGISRGRTGEMEYSIECSFMSKRAIARAASRTEAREEAARLIIRALNIK